MSNDSITGKSQIAKNTIMLYIRQIFLIIISLYTSRVVLAILGINDYGIYNVVGGIVLMFSFITSTMASASQRYLSYDIAQGDSLRLRETFSLILLSYLIISFVALFLCEIIAVWFLNTQMNIPNNRLVAANWVLQLSILTFISNLLSTPYMSVIIARERMGIYAYVSIVDGILKLFILYLLQFWGGDKLIEYAFLYFCVTTLITMFYAFYTIKKYPESRYKYYFEIGRLKAMFAFAWWNVLGSLANVLRSQGINILLNIFFNPAVNAARGIAYNVNSAISNFSNNFYTAVRPQIIKRYASGAIDEMLDLVFVSSKFAFYLLLILSLPVLFGTDYILNMWLVNAPEYSTIFVQLIVVNSIIEVLNYPLVNAIQATGIIKTYQLIVSGFYMLNLPISYFLLKGGMQPESTMYVNIFLLLLCFWPRLLICKKVIGLSIKKYVSKVIKQIITVTVASVSFAYGICHFLQNCDCLSFFFIQSFLIFLTTLSSIFLFGFSKYERMRVVKILKNKLYV